jgi:hypothetical protein
MGVELETCGLIVKMRRPMKSSNGGVRKSEQSRRHQNGDSLSEPAEIKLVLVIDLLLVSL